MSKILNRLLLIIALVFLLLAVFLPEEPSLPQPSDEVPGDEDQGHSVPQLKKTAPLSQSYPFIHFPDEIEIVEVPEPIEEPEEEPPPPEPQFTSDMKYISSIMKKGVRSYFFKESSTGRMYSLSLDFDDPPWTLLSDEGDFFLLEKRETKWKVRK